MIEQKFLEKFSNAFSAFCESGYMGAAVEGTSEKLRQLCEEGIEWFEKRQSNSKVEVLDGAEEFLCLYREYYGKYLHSYFYTEIRSLEEWHGYVRTPGGPESAPCEQWKICSGHALELLNSGLAGESRVEMARKLKQCLVETPKFWHPTFDYSSFLSSDAVKSSILYPAFCERINDLFVVAVNKANLFLDLCDVPEGRGNGLSKHSPKKASRSDKGKRHRTRGEVDGGCWMSAEEVARKFDMSRFEFVVGGKTYSRGGCNLAKLLKWEREHPDGSRTTRFGYHGGLRKDSALKSDFWNVLQRWSAYWESYKKNLIHG